MRIIITGCGRVGSQLAQLLSYDGHDVVVIDRDEESFHRLPAGFNGITMAGVAFDENTLLEAGIEFADAVAAVTNYDNTNLMVAEIAARLYDVPRVIARLYDPEKRKVFEKLGVSYVCGTTLVAERMMHKLLQGEVLIHQERYDPGVRVMEFKVPWLATKMSVGDIEVNGQARVLALRRSGRQIRWERDMRLLVGDTVVIAAKRGAWKALEDILRNLGLQT